MIASDAETGRQQLAELITQADVVLPFTGAGISTECGIPDFRSPGGLWAKFRPIPFDEFVADQEARNESWRRRFAMEEAFAAAQPGRGHRALASLYRAGKAPAIITQNIDNLHQHSGIGSDDVVELHGNFLTRPASPADGAMRSLGCARNLLPLASMRLIATAADSSKRRRFRSGNRCRALHCGGPTR